MNSKWLIIAPTKKVEPGISGLNQIDANKYAASIASAPNPVVKVGVSFDLKQWNIQDWLIG